MSTQAATERGSLCVNLGCGSSPTPGWLNFDNSPTVLLARTPRVAGMLARVGLLGTLQQRFVEVARRDRIAWADAARRIPLPDASARAIYSSHMIEHLDRAAARAFLAETRRVLAPGGVVRIAAPDLERLARAYLDGGTADAFVSSTLLARREAAGLRARLQHAILGGRDHAWMYDARSLVAMVEEAGFADARALAPGITTIPDAGALDLSERSSESVYVEATR